MKVRIGFVSNSSTSSFCIYGTTIETDVLQKMLMGEEWTDEDDDGDHFYEKIETKVHELGLEYDHPDSGWPYYIGISWSRIGDNETGRQFKDRVEALLEQFCGEKVECGTHEEAYHD